VGLADLNTLDGSFGGKDKKCDVEMSVLSDSLIHDALNQTTA